MSREHTSPLVSVITPAYNRSARLIPTVESVLAQSLTDLEYVIVDDGSADDTGDVIRSLARQDRRIRCFRQRNGGAASARSLGLSVCRGRYVAFLDHDD